MQRESFFRAVVAPFLSLVLFSVIVGIAWFVMRWLWHHPTAALLVVSPIVAILVPVLARLIYHAWTGKPLRRRMDY